MVPGNTVRYLDVPATLQVSTFPQSFPGNTHQAYLFPGSPAFSLRSRWHQGGTCFMLVPRERLEGRGTLRPPTHLSSLGEACLSPSSKLLLILQSPSSYSPLLPKAMPAPYLDRPPTAAGSSLLPSSASIVCGSLSVFAGQVEFLEGQPGLGPLKAKTDIENSIHSHQAFAHGVPPSTNTVLPLHLTPRSASGPPVSLFPQLQKGSEEVRPTL